MSILTTKAGARRYTITGNNDGAIIEFGPAGSNGSVGTMTLQFKGSIGAAWNGALLGRVFGVAADEVDMPFVPIPYRLVSLADVAQEGYPWSSDPISTDAIIQVPANGMSIAMLVGVSNGTIAVAGWDMDGPGAV